MKPRRSDGLGSPVESLRRKTANRKGIVKELPEGDAETSSDGPWGEVLANLESFLGRGNRNGAGERKDYRVRPDRAGGATPFRLSAPPLESLVSNRRPDGISQNATARYKNLHIVDSPSCLSQTSPRATDPPLSLKYGPAQMPTSTHRDEMGKVSDCLLT